MTSSERMEKVKILTNELIDWVQDKCKDDIESSMDILWIALMALATMHGISEEQVHERVRLGYEKIQEGMRALNPLEYLLRAIRAKAEAQRVMDDLLKK